MPRTATTPLTDLTNKRGRARTADFSVWPAGNDGSLKHMLQSGQMMKGVPYLVSSADPGDAPVKDFFEGHAVALLGLFSRSIHELPVEQVAPLLLKLVEENPRWAKDTAVTLRTVSYGQIAEVQGLTFDTENEDSWSPFLDDKEKEMVRSPTGACYALLSPQQRRPTFSCVFEFGPPLTSMSLELSVAKRGKRHLYDPQMGVQEWCAALVFTTGSTGAPRVCSSKHEVRIKYAGMDQLSNHVEWLSFLRGPALDMRGDASEGSEADEEESEIVIKQRYNFTVLDGVLCKLVSGKKAEHAEPLCNFTIPRIVHSSHGDVQMNRGTLFRILCVQRVRRGDGGDPHGPVIYLAKDDPNRAPVLDGASAIEIEVDVDFTKVRYEHEVNAVMNAAYGSLMTIGMHASELRAWLIELGVPKPKAVISFFGYQYTANHKSRSDGVWVFWNAQWCNGKMIPRADWPFDICTDAWLSHPDVRMRVPDFPTIPCVFSYANDMSHVRYYIFQRLITDLFANVLASNHAAGLISIGWFVQHLNTYLWSESSVNIRGGQTCLVLQSPNPNSGKTVIQEFIQRCYNGKNSAVDVSLPVMAAKSSYFNGVPIHIDDRTYGVGQSKTVQCDQNFARLAFGKTSRELSGKSDLCQSACLYTMNDLPHCPQDFAFWQRWIVLPLGEIIISDAPYGKPPISDAHGEFKALRNLAGACLPELSIIGLLRDEAGDFKVIDEQPINDIYEWLRKMLNLAPRNRALAEWSKLTFSTLLVMELFQVRSETRKEVLHTIVRTIVTYMLPRTQHAKLLDMFILRVFYFADILAGAGDIMRSIHFHNFRSNLHSPLHPRGPHYYALHLNSLVEVLRNVDPAGSTFTAEDVKLSFLNLDKDSQIFLGKAPFWNHKVLGWPIVDEQKQPVPEGDVNKEDCIPLDAIYVSAAYVKNLKEAKSVGVAPSMDFYTKSCNGNIDEYKFFDTATEPGDWWGYYSLKDHPFYRFKDIDLSIFTDTMREKHLASGHAPPEQFFTKAALEKHFGCNRSLEITDPETLAVPCYTSNPWLDAIPETVEDEEADDAMSSDNEMADEEGVDMDEIEALMADDEAPDDEEQVTIRVDTATLSTCLRLTLTSSVPHRQLSTHGRDASTITTLPTPTTKARGAGARIRQPRRPASSATSTSNRALLAYSA